jgi:hypothetical protein
VTVHDDVGTSRRRECRGMSMLRESFLAVFGNAHNEWIACQIEGRLRGRMRALSRKSRAEARW